MWEEEIRVSVFPSWKPHRNRRLDVDGSHSVARKDCAATSGVKLLTIINRTGAFLPLWINLKGFVV